MIQYEIITIDFATLINFCVLKSNQGLASFVGILRLKRNEA